MQHKAAQHHEWRQTVPPRKPAVDNGRCEEERNDSELVDHRHRHGPEEDAPEEHHAIGEAERVELGGIPTVVRSHPPEKLAVRQRPAESLGTSHVKRMIDRRKAIRQTGVG